MSKTNVVLLLLVVVSALGLITLRYQTGQLFSARTKAEMYQNELNRDYLHLQAVQTELLNDENIRTKAVREHMRRAPAGRTTVVRLPPY